MLVGQQLGPFLVEKEIGSGAMGAVYRGKFVKDGRVVAIKVMAPGFGATNASAAARFEREADILKQLSHPNIVRLFGVGKHKSTRYLAMEYIVGESLDKVMARRGRISWEEVVEVGKQLCAALQHAHDAGVVHRDLKPSNLMILPDGTLKLTDFGIAKDLDVTAITEANCTVGTAAYMSPEQCRGERDIGPKSDLYSLGVVFYELITGAKPFQADNAMDMFLQHVQGTFTRPSRVVLDLPVWMDTLVCQLLEKKPEQRPMNAAAVLHALEGVREKVEAQRSAGMDAVRGRFIDRPRGARRPGEEDMDAARLLMTGRSKKRKKKAVPFYRQVWFQALGLVVLLGAMAAVLFFVFRGESGQALYDQAKPLMASNDPKAHQQAYDGPLKDYQAHYAGDRGEPQDRKDQMLAWLQQCEVEECEALVQRLQGLEKKDLAHFNSDAERDALHAADMEDSGDLEEAAKRWTKMADQHGGNRWGRLAAQHLEALKRIDQYDQELEARLAAPPGGKRPDAEGPDKDLLAGMRLEKDGEAAKARETYLHVKSDARGDHDKRFWFLLAAKKVRDLDVAAKEGDKDKATPPAPDK
jgi:serine/threonine-protein kinase